ncbi:Alpha/beta hydrolase family protein [Posidoniimonas polymericola]|uniref:Alpha/beta hydrolase family protein n=1 Tax=Posidoniimonas polymericola TaxID=2528002 RepID=A0A5C5YRK0_9BACT|nr:alpha/beta hydrolase [Posidoniimonas polymericola]TWT77453.1 Alpha/beta hydrolase family protein [Posidoniimonas polymericola]
MPLPHLHLLPGLHGTPELYAPFVLALGDHPSSTTHYPDDPNATAEDILATIAQTTPTDRPYVLLAESFSGPFAARFAAAPPENLVGLVLVNTFLRLPLAPLTSGVAQLRLRMPWAMSRLLLIDRSASSELRSLTKRIVLAISPELVAARFRLLSKTDSRESSAQIRLPTLALHGRGDWFVLPYNSVGIERTIPTAGRKSLPGPHLLVQTHPERSLQAIANWWESAAAVPAEAAH